MEVDLAEQPVLSGDRLLLCSDGLSDLLEDEEILAILLEHADDPDKTCQALVDQANSKGGDDNITALLVLAQAGERGRLQPQGRDRGVPGRRGDGES